MTDIDDDARIQDAKLDSSITYLDYAGAGIPSKTQLRKVFEDLMEIDFANPHSGGKLGNATEKRVDASRKAALSFIGATEQDYDVIFTSGTTASLRLVSELLVKSDQSTLCYSQNSHTSVVGMRKNFANVMCLSSSGSVPCESSECNDSDVSVNHLLVLPGECNFSGARIAWEQWGAWLASASGDSLSHALQSHSILVNGSYPSTGRWLWLLDGAKLFTTSTVDMGAVPHAHRPHFLTLSPYKLFGYPTGVGVLYIRSDVSVLSHSSLHRSSSLLPVLCKQRYASTRSLPSLRSVISSLC